MTALAKIRFSALSEQQQALVLSAYAYELTLLARDGYRAGTDELSDPLLVRRINEVQHRVTSAIVSRLQCNKERYPDDVLLDIIVGKEEDKSSARLRSSFHHAWKIAFGTDLEEKYAATTAEPFLQTLASWFKTQQELLVLFRMRCGAGAKDFELYTSHEALIDRIKGLSAGTCVTAFKLPQLPLRGVVDDSFITKCLGAIPEGSEYLMVETVRRVAGRASWFHYGSGESHAELREDLNESRGAPVAVGLYPPALAQTDEVTHAVVPDDDGVVRAGPY